MTPYFSKYRVFILAALLCVCPWLARAVIVYDSNSNSNSANITDPGTTNTTAAQSLWNEVAQIRTSDGSPDASGVYLGDGFLLTANHVTGTRYFIMGTEYFADTSFGTGGSMTVLDEQNQALDLKLIKLSTLPNLPGVDLLSAADTATSQFSLFIGWGVGKGTAITNQGWNWGDSSTATERWGYNVTNANPYTQTWNANTYLTTSFNPNNLNGSQKAEVCSLTLGDSGGALFQQVGSVWKLAGLAAGVSLGGVSRYDTNLTTPGYQPDTSFYVSMPAHSASVQEIITTYMVPEPSALLLLPLGGLGVLLFRRRAYF